MRWHHADPPIPGEAHLGLILEARQLQGVFESRAQLARHELAAIKETKHPTADALDQTRESSGIAWAALAAGGMAAQPEFALRDGDRVELPGDSITEQKLHLSADPFSSTSTRHALWVWNEE
ncbi:MAG: hypothetical protein NTW21_23925 [Verrucomicrobia bacterium]|nr:hypothetical protein [Verrucomicrobiota bacterium]